MLFQYHHWLIGLLVNGIIRFLSRIIHWIERGATLSMKKYNDLKHRLMKIEMKNLVYTWLLTSIQKY